MPDHQPRLDRRRFLAAGAVAGAAAATGATMAGGALAAAARAARPGSGSSLADTDVLVIGAGLSGLNAAMVLEENGARVQVIEARQRIGGRVWTLTHLPGYPEVGGNSFGGAYGRVLDRVKRLQLNLVDYTPRRALSPGLELVMDGKVVSRKDWPTHPRNPFKGALRERMPWEVSGALVARNNPLKAPEDWLAPAYSGYDISVHRYARALGLDDAAASLAFSVNPYFGSSGHDVSALMQLFNDSFVKVSMAVSMQSLFVDGGNAQLPQRMAATLKREVHLGREVAAISSDSDGVTATCVDGTVYRARAAICSVPFSVLRNVRIDAPLAPAQDVAIKTLPYMLNTLVFMVPRRRFWEDDGLAQTMWTDGLIGTLSAQHFGKDPAEVTGLVANPRGIAAAYLDRLPPEEAKARVVAEIERIRPSAKGALKVVAMHSWATDRHAGGDWAVYAPGQVTAFANATALPAGRLHFCGEHTSRANRGMEGAMESGERAAIEVLEKL